MEENHTFFDEEREELIEEWPIQNIAKFGRNLVASEIRYYLEFQEYPNSLETGFASVYNVSGWDETDAKEAFSMKNIQYSYGGNGTIRTIKNCEFFPGIKVSKEQRECLGVKVCEFASKELDVGHTSVDFSIPLFKKMFEADVEFHKQATIWQAHEYQCGHINNGIKCTGKPKLGEFTQIISSISSKRKFIGCTNWKMGELDHRYMIIPDNVDLELLETMFNEYSYHANGIDFERDESNVIDECFMVRPNSTRSDTCPFLHKTGNHIVKGIINKKAEPCPVKFYHIIPEDLKNCPFIVTISVGIHNHPPPPPRKTPYNIKNQLQKIIDNEHILDLTARKLLTGFLDNGQYIILCATKQQLKTIKELTYIEIDMAFKRIHGKTNEWEVSAYLSHVQKTLTFVRIFTNIETAEAYKNLFEDLFTCIEKDTGEIFNFYHIHGKGLGCILADQHKGQALGLGQYLYSKYPIFSPIEHLQHIYKLCQVHYKRNIDKNKHLSQEIKDAMYLIPTLKIQGDVLRVLNNIQFCDEPGTEDWAKDKLIPWVLSGISVAFTKMDHVIWNQTPNNTNAGESAHANVNRDGCNLSLLAGIIRGCDFDKRSWESIHVNQQYNVSDSYRNKSDLARSIQAEKRTEKRRKGKQPVLPSNKTKKKKNNSNENDENLQIDQQQNRVALEKLNIQKQINDELEREITLLEKRKQLMN
ncbi:hypothetical protein Glove_114g20 [Diversispora epigaea]|uniref:MULE transposase domain-containing protein n=1 Tax=Diversispora epigaea TaxID=1348612 RepID=A0A397J1G1_9GLOM|nr:hypothetical protein Glove_114g20 [Diversispora epigaea]